MTWALISGWSSSSELYVPPCTIPAEEGDDQDTVILAGRDTNAVMSTD